MDGNRASYFLLADEIDHVSIRYTDFGEKLNRKKAAELLKFVAFAFREVAFAIGESDLSGGWFDDKTDEEIHSVMVKARTALLEIAFSF